MSQSVHPAQCAVYTYANGALHTASTTATTAFPNTSSVWTYTYNKRRLLKSESLSHAGRTFAITHAYNANGHRTSLTTPGNLGIAYAPNALGRPTTAGTYAHTASYHPNGAIAAFTYGNGATRAVTLNARKWPEWIRDAKNTTPLLDHTLTYDVQGNIGTLTDALPGGLETRSFSYDNRDRLTASTATAPGTPDETYLYDPLDNVRSVTRAGVEQHYHYGPTTHRLDRIATPTGETRVAYTWTARGELATRTDTTTPPPIPPNRVFADSFETGFPVTLDTYTFDTAGRMVAFNATTERYAYDAHGHRLQSLRPSTVGGRLHVYSRSGQLVYEEDTWTDTVTDYVHLGAQLVAKRTRPIAGGTATATYLHADHRGTPAAESNSAGTLTRRQRLGAYGLPDDGQYKDGPGFTGHVTDEITRLTYMQQRYYDPEAMRFISMDPVMATPGSFNRYRYAANNPHGYVDPDGRAEKVTGSNIPGNSVAIARMATTAAVAQTFDSSRVQYQNGATVDNAASKGNTAVRDANKVGQMANHAGDQRLIKAFNRIKGLIVDGQDFDKVAPGAIAFTNFNSHVNLSLKYFSLNSYQRTGRFLHETYHHDDVFNDLKSKDQPGCVGWNCEHELKVEVEASRFLRKNWNPENFE